MSASLFDIYNHVQGQGEIGRERGTQQRLGNLFQQAMAAPREQRQPLLGQITQAGGLDALKGVRGALDDQDGDINTALTKHAQMLVTAPPEMREQLYATVADLGRQAGYPIPDGGWDEKYMAGMQQLAGVKGQEEYTLSPGAKRFRGDQLVAEAPFAPAAAQLVSVPDGQGGTIQMEYDPRTRQFAQPQYGGSLQPQGMTGGGAQVMDDAYKGVQLDPVNDFQQFGQMPGVQVSSLRRTPERNAAVGGTNRSFHLSGEAGDFVVPDAQKATFIANARAKGYQAIDEGDHVHVEPPARGMTRSQFGQGQRMGYTPPKPAAEDKPSDLERRIGMAREMGASEAEIRQMVIGRDGAAAGAKPMPTSALKIIKDETDAASTAQGINNLLDKHLSRIKDGKLDFGPVANRIYETRNLAGQSNEQSRNYQEFKSDLERLRNESLRLNSGVQTDGDAQRAWNELFANLNDGEYVQQRLQAIVQINDRARQLRLLNVDMVRENYGRSEPRADFSGVRSTSSTSPAGRTPAKSSAPRRLKFNPATGRIE